MRKTRGPSFYIAPITATLLAIVWIGVLWSNTRPEILGALTILTVVAAIMSWLTL